MSESAVNHGSVTGLRLTASIRDAIFGALAFLVLFVFFVSIEYVELLYQTTRDHEYWELDELYALIPALALVAAWFSYRRWRELRRLNGTLEVSVRQLELESELHDVTEQRLRDAQKMEAVGMLAGGLAHELNNVLQPIVTLAQLGARLEEPAAEAKMKMGKILAAAEQGSNIVQQVLVFAAGSNREREAVALSQALIETFAVSRGLLGDGVEVETRIAEDPGLVELNPVELTQVIVNLLTNAADAMGRKGKLLLGLAPCDIDADEALQRGLKAGRYFRLIVRDNGPGMAPDLQARIFEPFFSTKPVGIGTGLGLPIVYGIVRSWGGAISVSSSVGRGTKFEILIPRLPPEAASEA